ncbi:MAG: phosphatidate cytidylyltransferase [Candidatus Eremiobacteraeota bacterium]|nr:phosphatidate cytidylyltransferase [Candidatus Eremiobacteraeota bacterium]MBV8365811.1 phosphatidate cytidylyltransferase [Candidatus Eremiobacteraeota bacterium]
MNATVATGARAAGERLRQELSLKRVGIGLLVAAIGIGCVFARPLFGLLILVIALLSVVEFARLTQRAGAAASLWVAIPAVAGYIIETYFNLRFEPGMVVVIVIAAMIAALAGGVDRFAFRWGMTVIAALYLGKIASYLVALRGISHGGGAYTLWLIIIVALTDIAGMIVGLQFGRTPLAPRISPGKTWEGAIAAFLVATGAGTLLGLIPAVGAPWYLGMTFAGSISIAAQLGDLVESALKRNAQVKDSGGLIIGHGGVFDRFDSYFLAGVVGYAILLWFGRVAA